MGLVLSGSLTASAPWEAAWGAMERLVLESGPPGATGKLHSLLCALEQALDFPSLVSPLKDGDQCTACVTVTVQ